MFVKDDGSEWVYLQCRNNCGSWRKLHSRKPPRKGNPPRLYKRSDTEVKPFWRRSIANHLLEHFQGDENLSSTTRSATSIDSQLCGSTLYVLNPIFHSIPSSAGAVVLLGTRSALPIYFPKKGSGSGSGSGLPGVILRDDESLRLYVLKSDTT